MKNTMQDVMNRIKELPDERKRYFLAELTSMYGFHENNIESLKEEQESIKCEKSESILEFGKDSYSAREINEKLKKLKKQHDETRISVKFFKEQVLNLIEK